MKKLIAMMLVLSIGLSLVCPCMAAGKKKQGVIKSGKWSYTVLENGTAEIWLYRGNSKNVKIPEQLDGKTVTGIGENDISMSESIKTITIPDCLTSIQRNPFSGCAALQEIVVSPDHPTLAVTDGVLFDKTENRLICCPCGLKSGMYEIPDGTQIIGDYAFGACVDLLFVTIPDSVTVIGEHAFDGCNSIHEIIIPDSVQSIGDCAFGACKALTSIKLPDGITTIGESAFSFCQSLTSVELPASVTSIGKNAFSNCEALTSITIPEGITSIGGFAFSRCKALASITIPDSVTDIDRRAFAFCDSLTITVSRDSYAAQFCQDNGLNFVYSD